MEIVFKTSKMKKICEDHKRLSRLYGPQQADQIIKRINEFFSAENLFDISKLPQARLHLLSGNRQGAFAVDLKHPKRIILAPLNGEASGLKTITKIEITDVCIDYQEGTMGETTFNPNVAIHPGKTLQETLEAVGMSQAELAERTGLTPKTINEIVQGKSSVTPETAIKLSAVFGMSVAFWNNLQRNYQETLARLEVEKKLFHELVNLRKFSCYIELAKWGYVKKTNVPQEKIMSLLNFFGVSSLDLVPKIQAVAFRKSNQKNLSHESLAAWLRCGELEAQKIQTKEFDKNKLINSLEGLRGLTRRNPDVFEHKMVELCASFGVAVVFVPYFKNTFVNGATRWVNDKAIVQLSLRGNYSDIFWFTFFHELAHVFKHGKTDQFVEFEDGKHVDLIEKEKEADEFATNTLRNRLKFVEKEQK